MAVTGANVTIVTDSQASGKRRSREVAASAISFLERLAGGRGDAPVARRVSEESIECSGSILAVIAPMWCAQLGSGIEDLIFATNGFVQGSGAELRFGLYLPGVVGADHAEAAARAAMKLIAWASTQQPVADLEIGVESGAIVLRSVEGRPRASGTVVATAGTLARVAEPGQLLIGETAFNRSHLSRSLQVERHGPLTARSWRLPLASVRSSPAEVGPLDPGETRCG